MHSHTVPYTSNNISVEFVWSDIKGYAASPDNQKEGRTLAQVFELLRDKLFKQVQLGTEVRDPIPMKVWFDHTSNNWNAWIRQDKKLGGPLSGTVHNLIGAPAEDSEQWKEWLRKAGDKESPRHDEFYR